MSVWDTIIRAAGEEFSGLNDIDFFVRLLIRLLLAILLGGIIGYEREQQGKAAGLRTHILVCLGAALFILLGDASGAVDDAMSRIIQGVIAGVGFLGAGTIIKNTQDVRGLTTAASIWFTAAIGVGVGLGHVALSLFSTLLAVVVLHWMPVVFEKENREDAP